MVFRKDKVKKYNKFVIWGLRHQRHTHRYIHLGFYQNLIKLGVKTVWVDDLPSNIHVLKKNDLVISVNAASKYLPIKEGIYYCLHNCEKLQESIPLSYSIALQVYTNYSESARQKWNAVTFFDSKNRVLYQPWGTNLLPDEFYKPVVKRNFKVSFWIGSIWNNEFNQGNLNEIAELKKVLKAKSVKFIRLRCVPDLLSPYLIRMSCIAPAIAGRWQVENNYLPCRMFKNISYGQLGISNVKKFEDILGECSVKGKTIEELVDKALSIPLKKKKELIFCQQELVKKQTYLYKLNNILKAFEKIAHL